MLPVLADENRKDFKFAELPTETFSCNFDRYYISGMVDGNDAMKQAIHFMLSAERYKYPIHSWNYGAELGDLFGMPVEWCMLEAERRITECLLQDKRITGVDGFEFEPTKTALRATFNVDTIFGAVPVEKAVII